MKTPAEIKKFIKDLTLLKDRAGRLELFKTMHALDPAVECVGFEVAELLQKKNPLQRDGKLAVGQLWMRPQYDHLMIIFELPHPKKHETFKTVIVANLAWAKTEYLISDTQANILENYVCVGMAKDVAAQIKQELEARVREAK